MADLIQIASADQFLRKYDPDGKLSSYYSHLKKENRKINLVSRETIDSNLTGITAASLMPFEVLGRQNITRYLDIGSGGGFPAIPILLTQVVEHATLVERRQKKAAALNRMMVTLSINADVLPGSFEELSLKAGFNLITMRLVRLDRLLLDKIIDLLTPGGHFIHYSDVDKSHGETNPASITYCYTIGKPASAGSFTLFEKV
ncbi:MAG: class I SAM-dependent methyltransferase [candidate division Zixibacteria bacterium]|nr:class I SAM-dependent methyltransferase [candidate division Zixibacteria bacterium]